MPTSWERFLHPETLRGNLISFSLFITVFEFFRERVVEMPKEIFSSGKELSISAKEDYKREVLLLDKEKNALTASMLWFKKFEAIDNQDFEDFRCIRKYRNELVHRAINYVIHSGNNLDESKFVKLVCLFSKIEKWWIINFEIAIDPGLKGSDSESIIPGSMMALQVMLDIALGNEKEEGYYYREIILESK